MIPHLAQTSPPVEIAAWLACSAFIFVLINSAFTFFRNVRGNDPHPPNTELHTNMQQLSTKHEALHFRVTNLESSHNNLSQELKIQTATLTKSATDRADKLYQHVDGVRRELSNEMGELESKLEAVPHQTVALLRNTGVIK